MSLNPEWEDRLTMWRGELRRQFYREIGAIEFGYFTTKDRLTAELAGEGPFAPAPEGTEWGAKWEYGWFRATVKLPREAGGKRIALKLELGAEALVFVDGVAAGARDKEHAEITLAMSGEPGAEYEVLAEAYAGHGRREETIGPVPPGRVPIPEPGPTQTAVGRSTYGEWDDLAFSLWLDFEALYQVRCGIDPRSLRVAEIDRGLKDLTLIVDFELPLEEMRKPFEAGRERLRPLLSCVNGSTAPLLHIVGQSHLDLAWLWPREETVRKSARTISTQLALMDEYPDFRFFLCQVPLFLMLEENYPELYARVLERVAEGRIIAEGGMWLESDTNLPSGESLIREFLYGKRFLRERFGLDSVLLWLPDSFGFSAALPQIMAGCGVKYFGTNKIASSYSGGEPFPYGLFRWQGLDGTRVLANLFRRANAPLDPATVIKRWNDDRMQADGIRTLLFPFGFGDGGGGPTREHLEFASRLSDLEGAPRTKMSGPVEFFREVEREEPPGDVYVGELYFPEHRGTYTSQAKTKKGNRKAEFALREAEFWGTVAAVRCASVSGDEMVVGEGSAVSDDTTTGGASPGRGYSYPRDAMEAAWKRLLLNQFHDVVTGTSIERVHVEAEADFAAVISEADRIAQEARGSIPHSPGSGATAFNSLSWERTELVPVSGSVLSGPTQVVDGVTLVETTLPTCGWAPVGWRPVGGASNSEGSDDGGVIVGPDSIENGLVRIRFGERGEITSILDKDENRELAAGPCNEFRMYRDVTSNYDAWDIASMYESLPVELIEGAVLTPLDSGPLLGRIRIERRIHDSTVKQDIVLRRGSRRLEFRTTVDWREDHKLLKVAFPFDLKADEAIHEIQFGHIKRPNHKSRKFDADRYEVVNHKWTAVVEASRGAAVLNDCKYGVNVDGASINLTLLKSAFVPDMRADRGVQEFTYALYFWNGPFAGSGIVREGYELNSPLAVAPGSFGSGSFLGLSNPAVVVEALKPAEDGSGDAVVRLYESDGSTLRCDLALGFPVRSAAIADMMEKPTAALPVEAGNIALDFRPFEIKTIRLKPGRG